MRPDPSIENAPGLETFRVVVDRPEPVLIADILDMIRDSHEA